MSVKVRHRSEVETYAVELSVQELVVLEQMADTLFRKVDGFAMRIGAVQSEAVGRIEEIMNR